PGLAGAPIARADGRVPGREAVHHAYRDDGVVLARGAGRRQVVERPQAEDIGIDPRAAALEQQLVAEQVGEARGTAAARPAAVGEEGLARQDFTRVHRAHAARQL